MKRREFLKAAGVGLATTAVAAPAIAQSAPEIKWRNTASWPKSLDTLYGGVEFFCKRVAEITDNKFQIQPFAAGEIVPGLQVLDAVQNGTVEMGNTAMYYYWGKDPAFTFGTALPFGLNSRQMLRGCIMPAATSCSTSCWRSTTASARRPATPARRWAAGSARRSRRSTTSRVSSSGSAALPARSSPSSASCRSSLPAATSIRRSRRARIDAAEWVGPYDDEKLGFQKVARYYYYPGWWEGCGQGHNIVNLAKWNELPKNYQAAFLAASHETWGWVLGKYDAGNPPAMRRLIANGALLRAFPQEVMEACYKAANEIYADLSKTNPLFKKLHDSVAAFRNDSYAWMQVAELGFDSFMMRMRTRT